MGTDRSHKPLLDFVSKITEITAHYSKEDLAQFMRLIEREFPALRRILREYLRLADHSDIEVGYQSGVARRKGTHAPGRAHLFDLLRSKKLFPSNSDLAQFARRILPGMVRRRFDKMSRADIAGRIIEYLEKLDIRTKQRLEESMRGALVRSRKQTNKASFFLQWERIIKGMEL